jgi:D-glycero-alpha-D-manno-heptose 1-phosphate guanylyltransferase
LRKLDAIVLAGGLGTRLRDAVPDLPKPLAPINGRPFLDILLAFLERSGVVNRVFLAVGYMGHKIIERYDGSRRYGFDIRFSLEQGPLGTGGAIKKAIKQTDSGDILCLNGDSLVVVDLPGVVEFHTKAHAAMTMVVREVDNTDRYGAVHMDDGMRIKRYAEKNNQGRSGYINAGTYVFQRRLFDDVDERPISLEKELLPEFLDKDVRGYVSSGKFIDIGTPETYKIASHYLSDIAGMER